MEKTSCFPFKDVTLSGKRGRSAVFSECFSTSLFLQPVQPYSSEYGELKCKCFAFAAKDMAGRGALCATPALNDNRSPWKTAVINNRASVITGSY